MKNTKVLENIAGRAPLRSSKISWPAIGYGIAAALALYLGFDLIQNVSTNSDVQSLLRHRPILMVASNIAAFLGSGIAGAVACRHMLEDRLAFHAYVVWTVVTVIFMVQVALTAAPIVDASSLL